MPLGSLCELLFYAEKQETEKAIYPLWLVHFGLSQIAGREAVPYDKLLAEVTAAPRTSTGAGKTKSGQEIINKFMPIAEADKGGKGAEHG